MKRAITLVFLIFDWATISIGFLGVLFSVFPTIHWPGLLLGVIAMILGVHNLKGSVRRWAAMDASRP